MLIYIVYTTVPLARIDIGSIRIDPEIGTDRWSVSTRPTRIRTDFWNDLVDLCQSGSTGPFIKLDRSNIDPG